MLLVSLPPSAARADDCQAGADRLGDRRALAALRVATDAACPCDGFSGGRARAQYQRCARDQIRAALDAGTLRRECLRTARVDARGAVCGTNRVACGGVNDEAESACRLAAPSGRNACGESRRFSETACAEQTHCSDVEVWTAGTCIDPRRSGPYGTGVMTLNLVKDSAYTPGTDRVLNTVVWYPTTAGATPIDPNYAGVLNAPLVSAGAPYPLLLFSHGSCGYALQSTFLSALLASYGYIVAAPPHPGNTLSEFPNCGTAPAQIASSVERPADMRFVLDQMLAANQDNGSPFFGAIDPDRVGMSGHSFGGLTTYLVAQQDARIKVAMPMAPAVIGTPHLSMPSLTMVGTVDSVVNIPAIRTAYANAAVPKLLVEVEHAGHYAFSNLCFPGPDCNPPTTLSQDEAHAFVLRFALPFLDRYLRGDESVEPFFSEAPVGVTLSQQR
jgi:predicted dienelactone hydrolase